MAALTKDELKSRFETADFPTGDDFAALIDSFLDANFENWPAVLPAASAQNLTNIAAQIFVSEWVDVVQTAGYVAANELVLPTNVESTFLVGRRVRLTLDGGFAYSEVLSATYSGGSDTTSVILVDAVADNTITDVDVGVFTPVASGGAAGLGVLGVSAFAASLLDDASAAVARQTLGENASGSHFTRKHNFAGTTAPTVDDDTGDGYAVGSEWYDTTNCNKWICFSAAAGAAIWRLAGREPGALFPFAGTTTPPGALECNGQNVSRTTYAKLFAAVGTTWGIGDGSTTFGLPDLRRRVLVGKGGTGTGTLGNAVGNTGGAETVNLQHAHSFSDTFVTSGPSSNTNFNTDTTPSVASNVHTHSGSVSGTTGNGGSTTQTIMQPAAVVGWFITV